MITIKTHQPTQDNPPTSSKETSQSYNRIVSSSASISKDSDISNDESLFPSVGPEGIAGTVAVDTEGGGQAQVLRWWALFVRFRLCGGESVEAGLDFELELEGPVKVAAAPCFGAPESMTYGCCWFPFI